MQETKSVKQIIENSNDDILHKKKTGPASQCAYYPHYPALKSIEIF